MARTTQPYRKSGSRPPSPVLDRMLAGRKPGAGAPLAKAMKGGNTSKRFIPRAKGNARDLLRARY